MTATVEAVSGVLNIELEPNTGLTVNMQLTDGTNPINLTGYTWEATARRSRCPDAETLATMTIDQSGDPAIQTITTRADVSGDLGGTWFDLDSSLIEYRIWFDVDDTSSAPDADGRTLVEVNISADDTADTVATALAAALDALSDVTAPAPAAAVVTVTNDDDGYVTPAADSSTEPTGFTFAVTDAGDHVLALTFSEANIDDIAGADAVWDLWGTPPGSSPVREVRGDLIWVP